MFRLEKMLGVLQSHKIAFVVIGGVAATAQGSSYITHDLDICYRRDADNLHRLVEALMPLAPRLRVSEKAHEAPSF